MPGLRKSRQRSPAPEHRDRAGPKLLFDRGILSRWFVLYRLIEEIDRASRYERPLAVMVARPVLLAGETLAPEARAVAAEAAARTARSTDLVGWLSDESILILMPETTPDSTRVALNRWKNEIWLHTRTHGGQKWDVIVLDQLDEFETLETLHASFGGSADEAVA